MKPKPTRLQKYMIQFDYLLVLFILVTTGFGLIVLDGTVHSIPLRSQLAADQAKWWFVSLLVFCVAMAVPYSWLKVLGWPLYIFTIVALLLLFFAAKTHSDFGGLVVRGGGAVSWLRLPFGSHSFQPAEFGKIAVVLVLAQWLAWRRERLDKVWECAMPLALAAVPTALVCLQPDLGTASVVLPLPFILLFLAGVQWRIILIAATLGIATLVGGVYYLSTAEEVPFLRKYQLDRIRVYLVPATEAIGPLTSPFRPPGVEEVLYGPQPGGATAAHQDNAALARQSNTRITNENEEPNDWQIRQAEMALGSGQIYGKGWRKGTQTGMGFLPEPHTDFIFSSLGEQFGLMGCLTLLGLYLLIVWRTIRIAVVTNDYFARYLVIGLMSIVLLHVLINIGITIRMLPTTGIPLPLVSYGGSFLASNYLIFGVIANVSMRR